MHDGLGATAGAGYNPGTYPPPLGTPPGPQLAMPGPMSGQQMAVGTPGAMAASEPQPQPQRTVLGVQAPTVGNYGAYRSSQQLPAQHQSGSHPMPMQPQGYPGYPQGSYPGYPPSGGYPQQPYGYPTGQMPMMGAPAVDPSLAMLQGKRSTLLRDIGIGVGIAALVLVGFLVVKLVVLDDDSKPAGTSTATTSKFATVKLAMPAGISAEMFVDGERIATVTSESPGIPITAGTKHIKLVGTNGLSCDDPRVKLEAGKTTTLECSFGITGSGSAGSSSAAPAQGSAAQIAEGSAAATGEAKTIDKSGTDKPDAKASDTKATDVKAPDTKASDTRKGTDSKRDTMKRDDSTKSDTRRSGDTVKTADTTKSAADDANKGFLQVFSKPPAKILVDGNDTSLKTPISGHTLALTPGKHKITFVIGDDRFTYPVVIKAGVTETMSKDLQ